MAQSPVNVGYSLWMLRTLGVAINGHLWDALTWQLPLRRNHAKKPHVRRPQGGAGQGTRGGPGRAPIPRGPRVDQAPSGPEADPGIDPQAAGRHRHQLAEADPLSRLHLVEEKQRLEAELSHTGETVDMAALEKSFIKVARVYGERKGISYSAWRTVGVSASVLQQAKIPRTRS